MLDEWFRDLCYNYKHMPASARQLIRQFVKFDMSRATDIFFQDQLAWGTIEIAQKRSSPVIILQQNILNSVPDEVLEEFESMSQAESKTGKQQQQQQQRPSIGGGRSGRNGYDISDSRTVHISDSRSVRSGMIGNQHSELQNLIWETASQGGMSKIPIQHLKSSREVIRKT
jgi:hypothetical protein